MSPEEAHAAAIEAAVNVWRLRDTEPADWITTYLASLRVSGYVVVPVEPTEEMIDAAFARPEYAVAPEGSGRMAALVRAAVYTAPTFPPEPPNA